MRTHALAAVIAVAAAPLTGAAAQSQRHVLPGNEVAVVNLVGAVTIEPGNVADVTVEATLRGRDASRASIEVGTDRGRPALFVVFRDDDLIYPELGNWSRSEFPVDRDGRWEGSSSGSWSGSWSGRRRIRVRGSGRGTEAWADLRIVVPAGRRVDVRVGVGTVRSAGVTGDLGIDAASARVTVEGHAGRLRLDTGSGGVDVRDVKGESVDIDAGSGGVRLSNVAVSRVAIDAGSGGVTADQVATADLVVDLGSGGARFERSAIERGRIETGSGGVTVEVSASPRVLDIDSGSGTVTLRLPASLDAQLDISTGSGSIDTDFPVTVSRMERRALRGTIGRGTGRISVNTGSGSVRLRRG